MNGNCQVTCIVVEIGVPKNCDLGWLFISYLKVICIRDLRVKKLLNRFTFQLSFFLTEGALFFTQVPGDTLYVQEGSSANLTWAYSVDNRTAELKVINWSIYNKTEGEDVILFQEEKSGRVRYNTDVPPMYGPERVTKVGQASILIKNVTFKDSTDYKCFLRGEGAAPNVEDEVKLIVTGMLEGFRVRLCVPIQQC